MNQEKEVKATATQVEVTNPDDALIARAKRAYKARCTRRQISPTTKPSWSVERFARSTCVVLRSDGELQAEYLWDGDALCYVDEGPARSNEYARKEHASVDALSGEILVARALECLHALNRAAKHIGPILHCNEYGDDPDFWVGRAPEVDQIYSLKDRFLDAMVASGRASVGTFSFARKTKAVWCYECDRTWFGDTWCRACREDTGIEETRDEQWFLVDCGAGYRFHRPTVSEQVKALATRIPAHDPAQMRREIPDVGLGRAAQLRCVERAAEFILNTIVDTTACPSECATTDIAS